MSFESFTTEIPWQMILLCGLSLSLGWGIRGNFGHEYGAAIPGALAAMAVVLMSGRPDWWRRIHYFAMFASLTDALSPPFPIPPPPLGKGAIGGRGDFNRLTVHFVH